jgi:hypothetical protein
MIVTSTSRVDIKYGMKAGELARILAGFPADATISVTKEKYYDQRDPGSTYITVTWKEER